MEIAIRAPRERRLWLGRILSAITKSQCGRCGKSEMFVGPLGDFCHKTVIYDNQSRALDFLRRSSSSKRARLFILGELFKKGPQMDERIFSKSSPQNRPCWINAPGSTVLRQCSLRDFSDQRATVASLSPLPDTFDLFLTLDSKLGRRCSVVSRSGNEVGVKFSESHEP